MTVTRQFLRLQRTALLVWGAILMLLVVGVTSAAPAVTAGGGMETLLKALGPALQQMAGGDISRFARPVDAYVVMKLLMIVPALVGVYVVLATGALLGWCLALPVIIFPVMGIYRLMADSDSMRELNRMIAQMPAALRTIIGGDVPLNLVDGWLQSLVFGSVVPLLFAVYTALAAVGILTREMDGRTMDFLLALPIRRSNRCSAAWAGWRSIWPRCTACC